MKDNNIIFYHKMMNYCPAYKEKDLLKLNLTWNKSETKEIIKLSVKFGKTVPSWNKCPTSSNEAYIPLKRVAPIWHLEKWGLCHLHGLKLLKTTCASLIMMMNFYLFHIKTNVSNRMSLNSPFVEITFMYNLFQRKRQKLLPKT